MVSLALLVTHSYKPEVIGKSYAARFPGHQYKLKFHSETSMTWTELKDGELTSNMMTVDIERIEVGPNVYLVT